MTYEEIISLGWEDRYPNSKKEKGSKTFVFPAPGYDYHIMAVLFNYDEDFDLISIKCVPEKTNHNEWENSETHFHGELKTKEELNLIMQFLGIIEYKNSSLVI